MYTLTFFADEKDFPACYSGSFSRLDPVPESAFVFYVIAGPYTSDRCINYLAILAVLFFLHSCFLSPQLLAAAAIVLFRKKKLVSDSHDAAFSKLFPVGTL